MGRKSLVALRSYHYPTMAPSTSTALPSAMDDQPRQTMTLSLSSWRSTHRLRSMTLLQHHAPEEARTPVTGRWRWSTWSFCLVAKRSSTTCAVCRFAPRMARARQDVARGLRLRLLGRAWRWSALAAPWIHTKILWHYSIAPSQLTANACRLAWPGRLHPSMQTPKILVCNLKLYVQFICSSKSALTVFIGGTRPRWHRLVGHFYHSHSTWTTMET